MKSKAAIIAGIIYTVLVFAMQYVFKIEIIYLNWIFIIPVVIFSYVNFNAGIYYSIAVAFTKLGLIPESYLKGEKQFAGSMEGMLFLVVIAYITGIFFEKSREKDLKLKTYGELIKIASEKDDKEKFYRELLNYTSQKFQSENAYIILTTEELFFTEAFSNKPERINREKIEEGIADSATLLYRIVNRGEKELSNFADIDFRYMKSGEVAPKFMAVPIESDGKRMGVIAVESSDSYRNFTKEELDYFSEYASIVGLILQNMEYYKKGLYDELLEIPSERYIKKKIESILAEQERQHEGTLLHTIVMADIDNFKKINEIYGSLNGDMILKQSADLLSAAAGENDFFGRMSGNRFLIILENKGKYITKDIIEELRNRYMEQDFFMKERKVKLTFSASIVSIPVDKVSTYNEIKELLEKRLYRAKLTGKNYIVEY